MRLVRGVLCALAFLPAAKGMEVKVLSPIPRPEPKAAVSYTHLTLPTKA